jgi:hypothetical protein
MNAVASTACYDETANNCLSKSTKSNYTRRQIKFIKWMREKYYVECFHPESDDLCIDKINTDMMNLFIGKMSVWSSGKLSEKMKSYSTPEGHHAAIIFLFKENILNYQMDFRRLQLIEYPQFVFS